MVQQFTENSKFTNIEITHLNVFGYKSYVYVNNGQLHTC